MVIDNEKDTTKIVSMTHFEFQMELDKAKLEQKVIDDANLEKIVSSWKEEEEYWIKRNKKLIDKACELLTNMGVMFGLYRNKEGVFCTYNIEDFRKSMMED